VTQAIFAHVFFSHKFDQLFNVHRTLNTLDLFDELFNVIPTLKQLAF
jgi:hypothetical protein